MPPFATKPGPTTTHTLTFSYGLWHGYLAAGAVTLLTSQWKSGKTTLASVLLSRLKSGGQVAGLPLAAGRPVVVSEESPEDWHRRARKLDFGDHVGWFCRPFQGNPRPDDWLALLDRLANLHAQRSLSLVVILADAAPPPGRSPAQLEHRSAHELLLKNESRIVSLPCTPDTIRGFSKVHMLVIDEAARVPDELYRSVRPMLAVSHGRLICLSTPHGKHGSLYDAWSKGGADWTRIEVPATAIERISPEFLDEERRCLGESYFRQEYCCSFEALHGLVYPDFDRCVVAALPSHLAVERPGEKTGRKVGGIDFGFRNPFAAVWGILDREDGAAPLQFNKIPKMVLSF